MTQMTHSPSTPQQSGSDDWPQGALPKKWIESLFERMEMSYGEKFTRQWGAVDPHKMRRFWAIELGALTPDQIKAGLVAMKHAEWPPTLPEFVAMCLPSLDHSAALYEAMEQIRNRDDGRDRWSDPAIYWAAIKIGRFDLMNGSHRDLLKRFTAALDQVRAQGQIDPVPVRLEAISAPGKGEANPERVAEEMGKIRATQRQVGNKDWAHKILDREKAGDKTLAYMTIKMAKVALGMEKA